ncbi:hypothetical protein AAFF_G00317260 [Aldrovandia affinis]|uniref:Uncharacterized protein n=1 Tax=Aldrovandia affinis TaxID=143900 RepID=A0AAD7VZR6_9TELE|nr:hypothetical protein AAFF_G00317260 [Aldrovandia affinis]
MRRGPSGYSRDRWARALRWSVSRYSRGTPHASSPRDTQGLPSGSQLSEGSAAVRLRATAEPPTPLYSAQGLLLAINRKALKRISPALGRERRGG